MARSYHRLPSGDDRMTLRRRAADLYLGGRTIRSVARQIGVPYGTTYKLLVEADVQFRTRGGNRYPVDRTPSRHDQEGDPMKGQHLTGTTRTTAMQRAADLYTAGASIRAIAAEIGRSPANVRVLLLEAGVTLRARGGNNRKAGA